MSQWKIQNVHFAEVAQITSQKALLGIPLENENNSSQPVVLYANVNFKEHAFFLN